MIFTPETRPASGPARIRWEEPPCPLCSGDRRSPILEAPDLAPGGSGLRFAVVRCDECGLHFTSPRPDADTISQFYPPGAHHGRLPQVSAGTLTLVDVLEHAHDPLALLIAARQMLLSGGQLSVTVPNLDGNAFRWFGSAWTGLDLPRHLLHFTPATLRRVLERAGFRVIYLHQIPNANWLRSSALLVARAGRSPVMQRYLTFPTLAHLAAWGNYLAGKSECIRATAVAV